MGLGMKMYHKSLTDYVNQSSTAGITEVIDLCGVLVLEMRLSEHRSNYKRGWGPDGSGALDIIAPWSLYVPYMSDQGTEIIFEVMDYTWPCFIGMDVKKYTVTNNLTIPQ